MSDSDPAYDGCSIPPEIYTAGMAWDPQPEVERLLFLAREAGVQVRSALELGCGAGRLLAPLAKRIERVVGVELNPEMAEAARQTLASGGVEIRSQIVTTDMCDLRLEERFDLIFTSPNTLRHVMSDAAQRRFWRGVTEHLHPGGIFVADLELGIAHERTMRGRPQCWTLAYGDAQIDVQWEVIGAPSVEHPVSRIRWTFCVRRGDDVRTWSQEFDLHAFEVESLLTAASHSASLSFFAVFEHRDPYLLPREPRGLNGRFIVVFRREA